MRRPENGRRSSSPIEGKELWDKTHENGPLSNGPEFPSAKSVRKDFPGT